MAHGQGSGLAHARRNKSALGLGGLGLRFSGDHRGAMRNPWGFWSFTVGYGSIPMKIHFFFNGMNIHFNPAMTWGEQNGTRVLTHPHLETLPYTESSARYKI